MKKDNTNLDIVFDMNIKKNDMGKKYNKNIVWISWASLFFGICFQFCSCKNKSNSSGNNLTITDIFNEKLSKIELTDEAKEILKEMNNRYLTLAIEALGGEL